MLFSNNFQKHKRKEDSQTTQMILKKQDAKKKDFELILNLKMKKSYPVSVQNGRSKMSKN